MFFCFPVFSQNFSTVTDICGNTYQTVEIGDLEWMRENFRCTKYSDGSDMLINPVNWNQRGEAVSACGEVFLYSFPRSELFGIEGWRVPTENDFNNLKNAVNSDQSQLIEGGSSGLDLIYPSRLKSWLDNGNWTCTSSPASTFMMWIDRQCSSNGANPLQLKPGYELPEGLNIGECAHMQAGLYIRLVRDKQTATTSEINSNVSIYPNPTNNILNIDLNDYKSSELFSIDGKSVLKSTSKQIDLSKEVKGIYFLVIEDINGVKSNGIKVIKE